MRKNILEDAGGWEDRGEERNGDVSDGPHKSRNYSV